ncbi:MAG: hypothetical protein ACR2JE_00310 [Acidobacteriaceae bacterium]
MRRTLFQIVLLTCVLFGVVQAARADGGRLQMRTQAGPFTVSLFTLPDTLAAGPVDVSVLVHDSGSSDVLMDAAVTLTLTPPQPDAKPIVVRLSHAQATNKLLQAAQIDLPAPGKWRVDVQVEQGGHRARCTTQLEIVPRASPWGTIWFFALLPPAVLLLFTGVQVRKAKIARDRRAQGDAHDTARSSGHDRTYSNAV